MVVRVALKSLISGSDTNVGVLVSTGVRVTVGGAVVGTGVEVEVGVPVGSDEGLPTVNCQARDARLPDVSRTSARTTC